MIKRKKGRPRMPRIAQKTDAQVNQKSFWKSGRKKS